MLLKRAQMAIHAYSNYLLTSSDCGLLDESEIDKKIELNGLIQKRITDALATAIKRGYETKATLMIFWQDLPSCRHLCRLMSMQGLLAIELSAIE